MINCFKKAYQYFIFYNSYRCKDIIPRLKKLLTEGKQASEEACFLYYKKGMFLSLIKSDYNGLGWRGNFAMAVGYAATGEHEKSLKRINFLCNTLKVPKSIQYELASNIASYMPQVSYDLVVDNQSKRAQKLKVALLIKLNRKHEAIELWDDTYNTDSKMCWYRVNLKASLGDKLHVLNECLALEQLEPVRIIREGDALSPCNIQADIPNKATAGPLVSILVTTYCSASYISSTLSSLLNQTYHNIEIIVIDDASTDNTVEIVEFIKKRDSRVTLLRLKNNQGTFIAKNEGLKLAKGEFITCHDSDDWAHPRKIELQVKPLLQDDNLKFTISDWIRMDEKGELYARKVYPLNRLNPASPLFRKSILTTVNPWDLVETGADSEFLHRLRLELGKNAEYKIHKVLTIGYHRKNSLMTANNTGYDVKGYSYNRLLYWEKWKYKHLL